MVPPSSRLLLQRLVKCWVTNQTRFRRVIVVLSTVLEHKPQAASAKQRRCFAAGGSDLPTFYFSSAVRYSFRGWQGYRASIISVSTHDILPQQIDANERYESVVLR